MMKVRLEVVLEFSEPVENISEVVANVATAISDHASNGIGIAPNDEDAYTKAVLVTHSGSGATTHVPVAR